MTDVFEQTDLGAEPDEVWKLIGDFVGFIEALTADIEGAKIEVEGGGVGMLRKVTAGGDVVVERLEVRDDAHWRTSYSMPVTGPFPVNNYFSTLQLASAGEGRCHLTWHGTFEPDGTSADAAAAVVRQVYTGGVEMLLERFGT